MWPLRAKGDGYGSRARAIRPQRITTPFVGESPPASGKFFYLENTALARAMKAAMTTAGLCDSNNFLERFKEYGWYVDDLVLYPVNRLQGSARRRKWREAQRSLVPRIKVYRPRAIVSLQYAIKYTVEAAAKAAGSDAQLFAVPFPGMGQQAHLREAMARIMPRFPREAASAVVDHAAKRDADGVIEVGGGEE